MTASIFIIIAFIILILAAAIFNQHINNGQGVNGGLPYGSYSAISLPFGWSEYDTYPGLCAGTNLPVDELNASTACEVPSGTYGFPFSQYKETFNNKTDLVVDDHNLIGQVLDDIVIFGAPIVLLGGAYRLTTRRQRA